MIDQENRDQREYAFDVLRQLSWQVADETSVNAMMAAMLGVLGVWLHYAHTQGVPAAELRADVQTMLDKVLPETETRGPVQ